MPRFSPWPSADLLWPLVAAAGEPEPGAALLEFVEPLIYQTSLDFRAVEAVSETRQRISEKLAAKHGARFRPCKLVVEMAQLGKQLVLHIGHQDTTLTSQCARRCGVRAAISMPQAARRSAIARSYIGSDWPSSAARPSSLTRALGLACQPRRRAGRIREEYGTLGDPLL